MKPIILLSVIFGASFGLQQLRQFGSKDELHDKEHIKQHLEDKIDVDKVELDPERERFHYFSMHDLNQGL